MNTGNTSEHNFNKELLTQIKNLQERVQRIEQQLNLAKDERLTESTQAAQSLSASDGEDKLEYEIGQYWFAKVDIVVLAIGVAFLLTFPYQEIPPVFPSIVGYIITAILFTLSYLWRKSYSYLSRYLLGGGLILLYFATLRLYFFSPQVAITNWLIEIILLILVVILNLTISIRKNSIYLSGITLTMGYVIALISEEPLITFFIISIFSVVAVYLQRKYEWNALAVYAMVLAYWTHALWSVNNPILGNEIHLVSSPFYSVYFILIYAFIFAVGNLYRQDRRLDGLAAILGSIVNTVGCYVLFILLTHFSFTDNFTSTHIIASAFFLIFSIAVWIRERSKYATFFYAMIGYLALSVAIVIRFELSDSLIWLSWQSILVITTAIWFRSKYIVVANFIIYLTVLIAFIAIGCPMSILSLSFGAVALLSARIMNAQQHRLDLKTEMMRNAYLAAAFFFFPYALYQMVPREYVSISWIGMAVIYYTLNLVLKKQKYRWMAIFTLLLTIGYVFIIGILSLSPTYRILSFLVLGVVLLAVSMIYTKSRLKKRKLEEQ